MGRKGSRYSLEEKLFYIELVKDGVSPPMIKVDTSDLLV
jgi:hypothetical protein